METEVALGIEAFRKACSERWPGVQIVIPVRPTGANYLISLTWNGLRSYTTIHEDDFADWGEGNLQELADFIDHLRVSESNSSDIAQPK
jgi:hypothetical protein